MSNEHIILDLDTGYLIPVTGTWEWEWVNASDSESKERCYCSECNRRFDPEFSDYIVQFDYCPNCGVRMED